MEKELARAIIPLVNDADHYPLLQQYVEERIEVLRTFLEKTTEHEKIREIQGAIAELRRFQTLRDQALEGAK
jgi:hypothetical protein